jgi:hypothetical protein
MKKEAILFLRESFPINSPRWEEKKSQVMMKS